ncbi:ferritin-like domain-containing protein [Streptomyces sp. NPDC058220]|uniref:ferritin-like domain-containing protein n=1 Tax=unclassified Streptomyces TaxID=2593676 RepID=UPI00365EF128
MGAERIDTRLLKELTEQSYDLNSDALRMTGSALADFAEAAEPPGRWWRRGGVLAGAAGAAALLGSTRAVAATSRDDIMALQTAASIENLAVSVYRTAAGMAFIKHGNKLISQFVTRTAQQHEEHAKAFNAAATRAGGKAQPGPDPKYEAMVQEEVPSMTTPAEVVSLILSLEDVASQTYTKNIGQVSDARLRRLFASVAPVEAQHRAILLAMQDLLNVGNTNLLAMSPDLANLPAEVGSVGFPDAFYPTDNASPISEGAVK